MDPSKEQLNLNWLKNKLSILWTQTQYCSLCLETKGCFYEMKNEVVFRDNNEVKTLSDIVESTMKFDVEHNFASTKICKTCTEKCIQFYIFTEKTRKLSKVINICVSDIVSKVTDISNELAQEDNQANLNVMIVTEYDKETMKYVNDIADSFDKQVSVELSMNVADEEVKNKGPVVIPTQRIIKHPRQHQIVTKVSTNEPKCDTAIVTTPTFSLKDGKIVITPLTATATAPNFITYSCKSCTSIFTSYRSLKEHEKATHNQTVYECRFCSKKYNSQQYLDVHVINAHSKSRCKYCHNLFETQDFNNHLKQAHEKQVHICKFCDVVYYTPEHLETHFKSSHFNNMQTGNDKTQCIMCLRSFVNNEVKTHKCKYSCLECFSMPCVHYSYLMSYREQTLNHGSKIRCLDCDFTTKRKEQLIAHVNREHLDHHPFTCNDCGNQFYTKLSLKTHIEQFHQDLKCQYCDHEFKTAKLLNHHRSICKSITRQYNCDLCVASFDTYNEMAKHSEICQSAFVYPCTLCKKEFTSELSLQTHHARIHSGIQVKKRRKFIECTLCNIVFNNRKEMLEHEESQHENEMFPCRLCSKYFPSLQKMYAHKQNHYSNRVTCEHCNKSIHSSIYQQHKSECSKFKDSLPFVCNICNTGFYVESALLSHTKLHAKHILAPCEYCHKMVKPASMQSHIEVNHGIVTTTKTLYNCHHCDYGSRKFKDLENHINKIHLKVKPFVCELCNKAFCGKARLAQHFKTHSIKENCFCTFCGKKFANKVCLKMHTRRHTGEKPYECNICFEKFRSASMMKTHRLKKHQDKTIQCPLCESMFHLAAEMRFHVKKAHWKRQEPFDFREIVPEEYHHLFEDRRLQKLGED